MTELTDSLAPADTLQSQLSAFMDDELPETEADLFVRRLMRDADMRQLLSRYQMMGEALRDPVHERSLSRNFSARIAAALEQDSLTTDKHPRWTRTKALAARWLKPVAGVAVAASVAMATLLVVSHQTAQDDAHSTLVAATAKNAQSYVVPASTTNVPAAPIPTARLTNYVLAHSEFSSPLGRRNVMTGLLSEDTQIDPDAEAQTAASADGVAP